MKFVIDRSKWRCARDGLHKHGTGKTLLLHPNGYMCCLGQCAIQAGANQLDILDKAEPRELPQALFPLTADMDEEDGPGLNNSRLSDVAMEINDDTSLTDFDREMKLTSLFADHDHELEFTGEYGAAS